jgi:hypothetical protein
MKLEEQVQSISSRAELVTFVRGLNQAHLQHPDWWENVDLSEFLEALAAWTEVMDKAYRNRGETLPDEPSWKMIGEMLFAATMYE